MTSGVHRIDLDQVTKKCNSFEQSKESRKLCARKRRFTLSGRVDSPVAVAVGEATVATAADEVSSVRH